MKNQEQSHKTQDLHSSPNMNYVHGREGYIYVENTKIPLQQIRL